MLIDGLYHRLVRRFRRPQHQEFDENGGLSPTRSQGSKGARYSDGGLNNMSNFVMNQPAFIENNLFITGKSVLDPVLEYILPYTNADAAVDSSARFPPPLCHPGTRLKIGDRLDTWLADPQRHWNMIWLHGPAGTGKSAVAQSFSERCVENKRLGASFFFSRPNKRNNPDTVIPSLIYQLTVHNHHYKSLVAARLAHDPHLIQKARHIQFSKLIVDPLLQLQAQKRKCIQEPLLVVLDGLDECRGENAQREIIEMISEAMRLKKDLPLLWLICSRPEAHLKYIFSRPDFTVNCGREELAIDAESIADVELYIQDGLAGIKAHFEDAMPPTWPSQTQIAELSRKASGHFGFASTALRYIGDETPATPVAQFDYLISFLAGVRIESMNSPLEALDALYAGILRDIPDGVLHLIKQILGYYVFVGAHSVQVFCNLYRIDQATFYGALRKLHSVVDVPGPVTALQKQLCFYHASFPDYLLDPRRSNKFIVMGGAWLDFAKMCLSWYKIDLALFHTTDDFIFDEYHEHEDLPGLKWISKGDGTEISFKIAYEAATCSWWACHSAPEWDDVLLSQLRNFDFRYIWQDKLDLNWLKFVNKLWNVDPSSGFIRTKPRNKIDRKLLGYMGVMNKSIRLRLRPAGFPLTRNPADKGYFLLGDGSRAIVCWATGLSKPQFIVQNCDKAPSTERIHDYLALFNEGGDADSDSEHGKDSSGSDYGGDSDDSDSEASSDGGRKQRRIGKE